MGACALAGFGPATTAPASGTSTTMAEASPLPPPKPLLAVMTPATCVKSGASWLATGSVSTKVPFESRTNVCLPEGSMRPSS